MDINDIQNFLKKCRYKKGQYIYYGVLHRNFGNETDKAGKILTDNSLAVKDSVLRCPNCDFQLGRKSAFVQDNSWECNETFCNGCDKFVDLNNAITEPMWIVK